MENIFDTIYMGLLFEFDIYNIYSGEEEKTTLRGIDF